MKELTTIVKSFEERVKDNFNNISEQIMRLNKFKMVSVARLHEEKTSKEN